MQDQSSPTVWEEPPADGGRRRKLTEHHPLVLDMKANPGRWVRFHEHASTHAAATTAARVKRGQSRWCQPAGSFEATYRVLAGKAVVYVRYIGAPNTPDTFALAMAYTEAFQAGNKVDVKWCEKTGDYEATVWKGLSCKSAVADSPAEALTEAARALADWLWEPEGEVRS
ncbi:MAG TPA: hypothetical protein VE198_21905 [Actinoallomurus sp.]|nr:hypothetical protein [Actinoallomurus sp.]